MAMAMSAYEEERQRNIARNLSRLMELGLPEADTAAAEREAAEDTKPAKKQPKKRPKPSIPRSSLRRSKRAKKIAPEYSGDWISDSKPVSAPVQREPSSPERKKIAEQALRLRCQELIEQRKLEVAQQMAGAKDALVDCKDPFLAEAISRWGPGVRTCQTEDWRLYVESRRATPCPSLPSPYALLQERYADDTWRLLVACVLMSRVSSRDTKERCIGDFFSAYPTPTLALMGSLADTREMLASLGLFEERLKGIVDISTRFLELPEFQVSLDKKTGFKIHGIGRFGYDSYLLFCRDDPIQPQDSNLRAYARWRQAERDRPASAIGAAADESGAVPAHGGERPSRRRRPSARASLF